MNELIRQGQRFYRRHATTILTCIGGIGVIATTITAVKATPKAMELLEEAKEEKGEELTTAEKINVAGPIYIPTILLGVGTISCMVGANVMNKRRQAALVSAYTLIDSSFKQYKHKLKELYGEEAHEEIIDAIAVEKAKNIGINAPGFINSSNLYVDEKCGETCLFYDEYGERFFEATLEQVISAEYHLNRNYTMRGYTVLNEFYEFLGLEPTEFGSEVGWAINDEGTFWIEFDHRQTVVDGRDCVIVDMPFAPNLEWTEYY